MFDFIDNQFIRIILEVSMSVFTGVLGFLDGIQYTKKSNSIGNIKNTKIRNINQENK